MAEHPKPVKITVTDPESGAVLEEKILANDYCLITAGNVTVKSIQTMGRTHMIAVGPPSAAKRRKLARGA
jgi:hypothetical protein